MALDEFDERREIIQIIGSMRSTAMADKFIVRWQYEVRAKIVELLLEGKGIPRRGSAAHQDEQEGNKEEEDEERKEEERSIFDVRNGWTPSRHGRRLHRKRYCGNMSHRCVAAAVEKHDPFSSLSF
jgi:hypothetical protein